MGTALYAQTGGYTGPGLETVTVAAAKNMRDDSPVALKGKITRSLGGEKYTFEDDTGSVTVEIDDHLWAEFSVGADDVVLITGEVESYFRRVEIDVNRISAAASGSN
jgi:uncharacterized protein (TIGR00156 family)